MSELVVFNYVIKDTAHTIMIDATTNEQHGITAKVTTHNVEKGSDISDGVIPDPIQLALECFISDTPINETVLEPSNIGVSGNANTRTSSFVGGAVQNYSSLGFTAELGRVQSVFDSMFDAVRSGAVFTITTSIKTYQDMVCESFNTPRNAGNANSMLFAASFKQLVTVTTKFIDAPAPKHQKKSRGAKPVKPVEEEKKETPQEARKTLLSHVTKSSKNLVANLGL